MKASDVWLGAQSGSPHPFRDCGRHVDNLPSARGSIRPLVKTAQSSFSLVSDFVSESGQRLLSNARGGKAQSPWTKSGVRWCQAVLDFARMDGRKISLHNPLLDFRSAEFAGFAFEATIGFGCDSTFRYAAITIAFSMPSTTALCRSTHSWSMTARLEILGTLWAALYLMSDRFVHVLEQNAITGWRGYESVMKGSGSTTTADPGRDRSFRSGP